MSTSGLFSVRCRRPHAPPDACHAHSRRFSPSATARSMKEPDFLLHEPAFDQVGVVPYRRHDDSLEVLLITSRTQGRWIVPKGNIEEDLGPRRSARMEALEEAGVEGPMASDPLGVYWHGDPPEYRVRLYLMQVETEYATWPECDERTRRWMQLRIAQHTVDEKGIRLLLNEVARRLW